MNYLTSPYRQDDRPIAVLSVLLAGSALAEVRLTGQVLGGGQGVVVCYGMAKPVRTPLIGPPRAP